MSLGWKVGKQRKKRGGNEGRKLNSCSRSGWIPRVSCFPKTWRTAVTIQAYTGSISDKVVSIDLQDLLKMNLDGKQLRCFMKHSWTPVPAEQCGQLHWVLDTSSRTLGSSHNSEWSKILKNNYGASKNATESSFVTVKRHIYKTKLNQSWARWRKVNFSTLKLQ